MKILVIRNDKLGDFMLAWPALSLLKKQYPDSVVTALVPEYTRPIAELCPWIDNILPDDGMSIVSLAHLIKAGRYDASISLFSQLRTAFALWLARVPIRVGPATKIAQMFLNRRLRQKRSLSLKPEYEYNLDLSRFYIQQNNDVPTDVDPPPYLAFDPSEVQRLREEYILEQNIPADSRLIFIHPGSGGSAVNLSLTQYAQLADLLAETIDAHFVITAGPGELDTAAELASIIRGQNCSIHDSRKGLVQFSRFISISDLFISGSTGPLHIAGALNVPTAAFYPARRSATSLRWQTLNEENKRISFSPENYNKATTTLDIDISKSADGIARFLTGLQKN